MEGIRRVDVPEYPDYGVCGALPTRWPTAIGRWIDSFWRSRVWTELVFARKKRDSSVVE